MKKGQTKLHSWIEAWTNIVVGFGINYCANLVILPLFGMHLTLLNNLYIGLIYTVISVLRSYTLRRFYNWRMLKTWQKQACA